MKNKLYISTVSPVELKQRGITTLSIINKVFKDVFSYSPKIKVIKTENSFDSIFMDCEFSLPSAQENKYNTFAKNLSTEFRRHQIKNSAKLE